MAETTEQGVENYGAVYETDSARGVLGVCLIGAVMDAAPGLSFGEAGAITDRTLEVMHGFGLGAMQGLAQAERESEGDLPASTEPEGPCETQERGGGRPVGPSYNLVTHLERQREFSARAFGPGDRTEGICRHIEKELREVRNAAKRAGAFEPNAGLWWSARAELLEEWIDIALLAFDGAWRAGFDPDEIAMALEAKLTKNEQRTWPDWRTQSPDAPIEHDRSGEGEAMKAAAPQSAGWSAFDRALDRLAEEAASGDGEPECGEKATDSGASSPHLPTTDVLVDIAGERQRQIDSEGFTLAHDDTHRRGELARAAAAYALFSAGHFYPGQPELAHDAWPFDHGDFSPSTARAELIKAGALIVAEIERLDRATQAGA